MTTRVDVPRVFQEATALHRHGRLADSERLYSEILRAQPNHFDALHHLGIAKAQQGNHREAEGLIAAALRIRPNSAEALSSLGNVLGASNRYEEALAAFQKCLNLEPGHVASLVNRGNILGVLGRYDEALTSYDAALTKGGAHPALLNNRGSVLRELRRFEEALATYEQALAISPAFVQALSNRCKVLVDLDRFDEAVASARHAIAAKPDYAEAYCNLGNALEKLTRFDEALSAHGKALAINPQFSEARVGMGNALLKLERFDEALAAYDQALAAKPALVEAWVGRGDVLLELKRYDEANAAYNRAISIRPDFPEAWFGRGNVHFKQKQFQDAAAAYDRAIGLRADFAEGWLGHATVLFEIRHYDEALAASERALALKPDLAEAWCCRGSALSGLRRYDEASAALSKALELKPNLAEAWCCYGNVLSERRQNEEALGCYDKAIAAKPELVEAWQCRATLLGRLRRFDEALTAYDRILGLEPDFKYAKGSRLLTKLSLCDWEAWRADCAEVLEGVRAGRLSALPFGMLMLPATCSEQLRCTRGFVEAECPPSHVLGTPPRFSHDRIRLAYVSADFREHAVASLIAGVFELHDRSRFETTALSLGPDDDSEMGRRVRRSFDRFIDIRMQSNTAVAQLMRMLEIDIAIDLLAFTEGARTAIFAQRPAPIQVNYLGYPGTMGAAYIDYIIADPIVIAPGEESFYTENIVYLPHSYQANDDKREIAQTASSRAEEKLPWDGFVFCCFNQSNKITPEVFDVWMRILRAVDGSVLWLIDSGETVIRNLRREAAARGVSADRLVFAPRTRHPHHLARHLLADLSLDTLLYNAHTTASDALWAGLPVLTCLGATFPGRVAASLLHAVGLPELVTRSLEEYEATALRLARDSEFLASLKAKLVQSRASCPLFDTKTYTRHLESAYRTMWERRQRGEEPRAFRVDPAAL